MFILPRHSTTSTLNSSPPMQKLSNERLIRNYSIGLNCTSTYKVLHKQGVNAGPQQNAAAALAEPAISAEQTGFNWECSSK